MAKSIRAGPTFTQEILDEFIAAVESFGNSNEHPDIAFKQVAHALQKFLHYGMSRFSVETLQNVLDDLIASNRGDGEQAFNIRSLTQLRTVVKMTIMRRDAGSLRASDANSLKYIETFFYCVYCLSEAKRMFDQIYENFYFTYFDPNGVSRQSTKVSSAQPKDKPQKRDSKFLELEDYSQFGISTLQQMTGSTQHKLRQTVRDIKDVLDRWSELLTDEEPNTSSFDPESEQDLHLLHGVSGLEPILRLVPDLFAKYYKCMELTKQWWVLAHDAYPDVPFKRRPSDFDSDVEIEFSQASSSGGDCDSLLSDKNEATNVEIEATKVMIIENQKVITSLQEEIDALDKREEKFDILKETYDKVGMEIEDKKKEQKRLRVERERLNADEKKNILFDIEENLNHLDRSIRLLEFQQALLFEDFMIHLEIRPSMIRFQDDAKTHLKEAQATKEKNMAYLQKLRDSHDLSETQEEANAERRKNSVPTIIHSTYSPNNEKAGSPAFIERQSVKEKGKSMKMGTFTVEENKTMNNQSRRVNRDPVFEKRYQTEKRNETGASRKEYAARPGQTMSEQRKEDTATAADVEEKEKKLNVLKRANNKQTVEAINLVQNVGSKTVSKKGFAEQENQRVPNENLRRTYDLSTKTKMDPQRKRELKSSERDMTPRQKNERMNRKDPTTSAAVDSSLKPLESENRSNRKVESKGGNDARPIKKVNSQSSPSLNGQDVAKLQEKKSKVDQTLRPRRPPKPSHGITNQTPAVKSK